MKRLLLFLCLASLGHLSAQENSRPEEHVSLKFTVVGWGDEFEDLSYRQNGTLKKLGHVPIFARSEVFEYSGPATFELHRASVAKTPASPEKRQPPVATVPLPKDLKRVMILVSAQNDRYQLMVVPDDLDAVPPGQAKLMNLTEHTLAIRTNKKDSFTLAVGTDRLVSPNTGGLMQMEIAFKSGTEWKKADSTFLRLPNDHRTVIFFLKSDSAYFKDVDGRTVSLIENVVMREPVEAADGHAQDR